MSKPNNWYHMSYEERLAWEKQERARADLEYERDRERESRERTEESERRLRREYRSEMDSAHEQRLELHEELEGEREKVKVLLRFIELKGLKDEYKQWVEDDNNFLEEEDDGL